MVHESRHHAPPPSTRRGEERRTSGFTVVPGAGSRRHDRHRLPSAELLRRSATEQAALVRSGEISARELVEASLDAIERLNAELNAFVALCAERALAEADRDRARATRARCAACRSRSRTCSRPTEGLPTTHGSARVRRLGRRPRHAPTCAACARRARSSSARRTRPSSGCGRSPRTRASAPTRNPWDPRALAGRLLGRQRRRRRGRASSRSPTAATSAARSASPPSCCGLVGLKPSRGPRLDRPRLGDVGAGVGVDGVLTRTVLDTAVALDAMAGYEPGDRHGSPPPPQPFADARPREPRRGCRVRVALDAPLGVPVDDEPRAAAARAARRCSPDLGHDVVEQAPDWDDDGFRAAWATFAHGAMQHLCACSSACTAAPSTPSGSSPRPAPGSLDARRSPLVDHLEAAERLCAFAPPRPARLAGGRRARHADAHAPAGRPSAALQRRPASPTTPSRFSALVRALERHRPAGDLAPARRDRRRRPGRRAARRPARPRRPPARARRPARGRRRPARPAWISAFTTQGDAR